MNIILEGVDGAGKSTLAVALSSATGMKVQGSEGPPKDDADILDRIDRYLDKDNTIFDRHPCVSQTIYGKLRGQIQPTDEQLDKFYTPNQVLIYCHPSADFTFVSDNDCDTEEYVAWLIENYNELCRLYEQWALGNATYIYRIGDPINWVIDYIDGKRSYFTDIREFHKKFGLEYYGPPRALPKDILDFRLKFLQEEMKEYLLEATASKQTSFTKQQSLKELVDLVYVALGTAHLHGFDFDEAWHRVHQSNMKKVRATDPSQSKRASSFDVVKPEGWVPPSMEGLA